MIVHRSGLSDKSLHFLAYLILTFLLWHVLVPDRKVDWRKTLVWWVIAGIALYAIIDEVLQRMVGRSCDPRDFIADMLGTATALALSSIMSLWPAAVAVCVLVIFGVTNISKTNLDELLPVATMLFHLVAYGLFTAVWICFVRSFRPGNRHRFAGFFRSLLAPVALLVIVKSISPLFGKPAGMRNTLLAAGAIVSVALVACVFDFLQRPLPDSPGRSFDPAE